MKKLLFTLLLSASALAHGTACQTFAAGDLNYITKLNLLANGCTAVVGMPSLTLIGTGGAGYLELPNQSSAPGTPTSAARFFVDSSNRFSWKGTNGYVRTLDGTANTANRVYTLPDASIAFGDKAGSSTQAFSVSTLTSADTTDASSAITGAGTFAGGVGIAKKLYVGTDTTIGDGSASLSRNLYIRGGSDAAKGAFINLYRGATFTGGIGHSASWSGSSSSNVGVGATSGLGIDFFVNNSTASSATITSTGNVGLTTTPAAWQTATAGNAAIQAGNVSYAAIGGGLHGSVNGYYDGVNWRYISTSTASNYYQDSGNHVFRSAVSGTAGNVITWTTPLSIAASTGDITAASTIDSSSSITGALKLAGGLGVAKKIYAGTSVNAPLVNVAAASNTGIRVTSTDGSTFVGLVYNTTDNQLTVGTATAHPTALYANNAQRLTVLSSGRTVLTPNNENFALQLNNGATLNGPYLGSAGADIFALSKSSGVEMLRVDAAAHVKSNSTAPALTSCGTTPAITGSDTAGTVTMGTGSPTGCVITFATAYASTAPHCVVTWQANLASMQYTISTTAITLVQTATSSNKVNYVCFASA